MSEVCYTENTTQHPCNMISRSVFFSLFFLAAIARTATAGRLPSHFVRYDPLFKFAVDYTRALNRCNPKRIAQFYDRRYTAYELDGETYGKERLVKSVTGWCETFGSSSFELISYKRVSFNQFYVVMKMHFDGFKTGELRYSQTFTVKRRRYYGRYLITADLRGINGERIAAAMA